MRGLKYAAYAGLADGSKRRAGGRKPGGEGGGVMGAFTYFPLLVVPVVVYNLLAWGGIAFGGAETVVEQLDSELFRVPMASSPEGWVVTPGDLLLSLALILLFIELLKATSTGRSAIANHALSLIVFIACMIEFLLFGPFATSVFFLITLMALLDVLAGFIVTIVTARRDIAVGEGFE